MFHIQQMLNIIKEEPLNGSFAIAPSTEFSFDSWFDGKYQSQEESYLNENFGLRNTMVQLNNEINYRCFKVTSAQDVVIGKQGYLFEKKHIEQFLGADDLVDDGN